MSATRHFGRDRSSKKRPKVISLWRKLRLNIRPNINCWENHSIPELIEKGSSTKFLKVRSEGPQNLLTSTEPHYLRGALRYKCKKKKVARLTVETTGGSKKLCKTSGEQKPRKGASGGPRCRGPGQVGEKEEKNQQRKDRW